ncbi:MAG: peptidoglycan editing factor PgeF [Nitrospiraceae bacterium]
MMTSGLITVPAFAGTGHGIRHFFGTRLQSTSLERESLNAHAIVSVKQVHGTDALIIDRAPKPDAVYPGGWDALISDQTGVLLTVRTADCVPVLCRDARRQVIAAVHAGWRGTVAGIISKTLAHMRRHFHSAPGDISMVIGPSAGPCCYEVDEQVLSLVRTEYPYWRLVVSETGRGRALLDLRALIRRQAQADGVDAGRIWTVKVCTICHPRLFYSYRREGIVKQTMVSGIMLAPADRRVTSRHSERRSRLVQTF